MTELGYLEERDIQHIYVPFNPKDQSPVLALINICPANRRHNWLIRFSRGPDRPICRWKKGAFYLAIKLKTAETIGLTIPDEIQRQPNIIVG